MKVVLLDRSWIQDQNCIVGGELQFLRSLTAALECIVGSEWGPLIAKLTASEPDSKESFLAGRHIHYAVFNG